jgi:hypothetical protein
MEDELQRMTVWRTGYFGGQYRVNLEMIGNQRAQFGVVSGSVGLVCFE